MNVEQFVMAYRVEQDRLRAMMPEGFESLRPVLRINAEIRGGETDRQSVYIEFNTPVQAFNKRGWLNIANWESTQTNIVCERQEKAVTFKSRFLEITYTGVGVEGGCPAENDNDGCFFLGKTVDFVPAEQIKENKEFCDCAFKWKFAPDDAHGISVGGKSVSVIPTPPKKCYERQGLSAESAARIACEQILGSYVVRFER